MSNLKEARGRCKTLNCRMFFFGRIELSVPFTIRGNTGRNIQKPEAHGWSLTLCGNIQKQTELCTADRLGVQFDITAQMEKQHYISNLSCSSCGLKWYALFSLYVNGSWFSVWTTNIIYLYMCFRNACPSSLLTQGPQQRYYKMWYLLFGKKISEPIKLMEICLKMF